jgi:DNA repair exonuclease SbcCD ATPase subunit
MQKKKCDRAKTENDSSRYKCVFFFVICMMCEFSPLLFVHHSFVHIILLYHICVDVNSMTTTHSPVAQVEVEDEIAKLKTKIEDLEATIKEYENEYKQATREERKDLLGQMIIANISRLHDLNEKLKTLRQQQQGKEQRTRPFIFMVKPAH